MRWLQAAIAGIALGVLAAWADVAAGGLGQNGAWRALSMVTNAGCTWAGLAVLCGWLLAGPLRAAAAGVLGLAAAVAGYYAYGAVLGDREAVGLGVSAAVEVWLLAAVLAGPVLGTVGALSRRAGLSGLSAALALPAGVITEMLVLRPLDVAAFRIDPAVTGARLAMVGVALGGAAYAVVRAVRPRPSSPPAPRTVTAGS